MENIQWLDFIQAELLILIPVLNYIGFIIKSHGKIQSNYIPLILAGFGIFFAVLWTLSTYHFTDGWQEYLMAIFVSLVQGLLCAAGAVFGYQTVKQLKGMKQ